MQQQPAEREASLHRVNVRWSSGVCVYVCVPWMALRKSGASKRCQLQEPAFFCYNFRIGVESDFGRNHTRTTKGLNGLRTHVCTCCKYL